MSKSIYEYVRSYEESNDNHLLKDCFIVVRVDGQGFHQFSKKHDFKKPNDKRFVIKLNKFFQIN
jgi:tRNA(His) guanylyltransferase